MEYFRDYQNQIYADVAYRLGTIILQYENCDIHEDLKFESTLCIAVLQNLLVYSKELLDRMIKCTPLLQQIFSEQLSEEKVIGISSRCIMKNTFNCPLNIGNFIKRLRNSLSHQTNINLNSNYPSTGFTTINGNSGKIEKYCFIDSPEVDNNQPKKFRREKDILHHIRKEKLPDGLHIDCCNGYFYLIGPDGEPFSRIFKVEMMVTELREFTLSMANLLSQPIQRNWNGITVNNLIRVV